LETIEKRFIIGIDLGTTNSAVSYADLEIDPGSKPQIRIFKVPQLTGPGEVTRLPVLPSFLYIPGKYDISGEAISISREEASGLNLGGEAEKDNFVGAFARDHGAKVPARLVSSAKSWLCHANVDRRARILPWGAGDEVYKVSPVQATAAYLRHVRNAWNRARGEDEELYLENQIVILTVPASFDEVARDLTVEAAALAGIPQVTLLEEPLAAFYSWLARHEKDWSRYVTPGELILVCDVGGGTTDFTLITLREVDGSPRFERIAVGDHLILGGDNIDLALARRVEMRLRGKQRSLSADRWKALCHQCREAKEAILDGKMESRKITLMGTGTKLIAETVTAKLSRSEVEETVAEGFFPLVNPGTVQRPPERKGITEFGLPYEPEPAVTSHLGWFLERHRADVEIILGRERYVPDLILFNGGSLKPLVIRERIREAIRYWFKEKDSRIPRVLENPDPKLSVALGASYYGLVKIGQGVKVGSGSARAYYLGIAKKSEKSEDTEAKRYAICLVERGLDEGSDIELKDKRFEVLANQPVSFEVFSSSFRSGDRFGDLVEIDETFTMLPPVQTVIRYGKKVVQTRIPVQIEGRYTEMGTLALWCRSLVSSHRWQLQFQLRDTTTPTGLAGSETLEESKLEEACAAIRRAYSKGSDATSLEALVKDITDIVGRARERWPLLFIRRLSDELLQLVKERERGPDYESRWLNLCGFCMRPGFGDGFDEHRMQKLWRIHKTGPVFAKNAQVRSEWWIMWRRVAGGLKAGQQRQFVQEVSPQVLPKKGVKTRIPPQERLEIWMAVANMERLLVKDKIKWGQQLLSEIMPKKYTPQHFWSLSRLGARELLYGPVDRVIPPEEVAQWIEALLAQNWNNPKPVGTALAQLGRKTGDRTRDIDEALIVRILDWLRQDEFLGPQMKFLKEIVPMAKQEESAIFGESLPSGLVLHA
jgi:molecular chaperone DnaK (HSP70)